MNNYELFLKNINHFPINDNNKDRESFSLMAGFALGLSLLGKGKQNKNMYEKITLQLLNNINNQDNINERTNNLSSNLIET